ncbi:MAG TPA: arginase family protein, partial [Candidatus Hydrogenedentes bacterium]|nr:arginase family protein [Candidatus Hydrogenedentota bacterium]
HQLRQNPSWPAQALDLLNDNVYVTIDLDVFDPSVLPATGTPEPGGLGWYDVIELLDMVARSKRVMGFDIVELCPMGHPASEFVAAKLLYTFLSLIHAHHAWH